MIIINNILLILNLIKKMFKYDSRIRKQYNIMWDKYSLYFDITSSLLTIFLILFSLLNNINIIFYMLTLFNLLIILISFFLTEKNCNMIILDIDERINNNYKNILFNNKIISLIKITNIIILFISIILIILSI